ncbi:ATP-grasp domain-containing protein [Kitasatospora sp. MAP5-34]|uniref:ATP-grasp domain-containing protein n=1 Tax=Kitasatospora sp. MAP5-34 TaxID=3035102 RepID=UPI0024737CDE|nr:ATP-grasp domain-containing protein [Kitasatospora sp. MAP5-34]MDH6579057.1 biotin carboxylase [Kitasatospora sp. MAP5-34]
MKQDAFVLTGSFLVVCRTPLYLSELTRRGLKVLLITPSNWREEALSTAADPSHPASAIDEFAFVDGDVSRENSYLPGVISSARRWREKYNIVGVYAAGETQVEPTGLLADALGLPGPGLRATRACRSKYLQRWYLPEFSPVSLIVAPEERAGFDLSAVPFPVVVKPAGRHSSSGVALVQDEDALRLQLDSYPPYETVLVEERVAGQEYSVESLVQDGQIIFASVTRKDTTDSHALTFVELSHSVPSDLAGTEAVLLDANRRALRGLDFKDGIAHAEWRVRPGGTPFLMEVAARTPGDGICVLYELATSAPLEPQIIRIALGEPASYPAPSRYARQIYLEHTPGILRDVTVDGFAAVPQWVGDGGLWPHIGRAGDSEPPTLRAVLVHQDRGSELGELNSSEDRAVSLFVDALTVDELNELEEQVRKAVTIHTTPVVPDSVTHVVVGYSPVALGKLDKLLPENSVLLLEEPAVIEARGIRELVAGHRSVAALFPTASQDEAHAARFAGTFPRPAGVRVVVPMVEYGVVTAAALAEAWELPGASLRAARVLRDKSRLRAAVAGTDIAQPAWALVESPADVEEFRARQGGEYVLKPANRQASLGVQLLGPDDDVEAAWLHTTSADEPTLRAQYPDAARFLAEERLHGPEVSVEALVHDGTIGFLNITDKSVQDSRYPVETGHVLPAELPAATSTALAEGLAALVKATGFGSGILHSEWIVEEGRPYLVECAGRLPGDGITVLIDLAYDTHILRELLQVLGGDAPTVRQDAVAGASVRFLTSPTGVVERIEGVEEARASAGVHALHLTVAVGDDVQSTATSSWDRIGSVIAVGADPADAVRNAERAVGRIAVSVGASEVGEVES